MKTIIVLFFILSTGDSTPILSDNSGEKTIQRFDYEADFEAFKDAVVNEEKDVLKNMSSEDVDMEMLLILFEDPELLDQLKKATYDDLTLTESDGRPVLELAVYISGSDEEGNTYESGVSLYFDEGLYGLKLLYMIAAG